MKIIESPVKPPPPTNASPVLTNLILWLLQKDPRLRPSIRDLLKEVVVRHRLREEGLALPEEMLDAETTNYLEQGLPTQLPKDLEEKASVMEDDGTVGLMTTLVDDKDAAHRSFRIAAAALSAQSSSNQMGEAAPANAAAPPVHRGPSGRFAPPTAEGHAAPTAVKRTGSTTVSRTNSNVSVGAAAAAVDPLRQLSATRLPPQPPQRRVAMNDARVARRSDSNAMRFLACGPVASNRQRRVSGESERRDGVPSAPAGVCCCRASPLSVFVRLFCALTRWRCGGHRIARLCQGLVVCHVGPAVHCWRDSLRPRPRPRR